MLKLLKFKQNEIDIFKNKGEMMETIWEALRITIRKGTAHSKLLYVIKKGVY